MLPLLRGKEVCLTEDDANYCGRASATRELSFKEAARGGAFRPLGEGDVDVGEVIAQLECSGYRGWYVLEQDTVVEAELEEGEGRITDVRKSLACLQRQLEKIA